MKYNHFKHKLLAFVAVLAMFVLGMTANAQQISVSGVVKDAKTGEAILGASILEKGTNNGVITNNDGAFTISAASKATLVVKYLGYVSVEVPVSGKTNLVIQLNEDAIALGEVVAIGYGSVKKNDATGAVVAISADKTNKGLTTSLTDMLAGKLAGVTITTSGGAPGAGATVLIRGGSSIYASNDPLYVIDGIPIDGSTTNGLQSGLSEINPQDIETFTVLKDASATAIYGSRATGGVILITTKKGSLKDKFSVTYDGNASVSSIQNQVSVLSASQYTNFIKSYWGATSPEANLLGTSNTNWQNQIFQTATSQDHNVSVSGYTGKLPYRVSVGYTDQNGVLKTSNFQRLTGTVNLNPTFLDDHLKVNVNLKGAYSTNRFADTGAIGAALNYDPTQSVYNLDANGIPKSSYGNGYTMWLGSDGKPLSLGTANPLSVLTEENNTSKVYQSIGNVQFDYTVHGLPELKAHLNLAYDLSRSNGDKIIAANSPMSYVWGSKKNGAGEEDPYYQYKSNTLMEFYLNYTKTWGVHSLDVMGGYSDQHFYYTSWSATNYTDGIANVPRVDYPAAYNLISFYGRLNYTLMDKYLLTVTLRNDGSSRFAPGNQWGLFPSAALAWKLKEESFLKDVSWLSDLKLRASYGVTGQQNVGNNYYSYLPTYTISTYNDAQYQFGNSFYHLLRPAGFNANLKWETTDTYNVGLDFGAFNNRLTASVEVYKRITNNLLNIIPVPAGSNFINNLLTNIGSLENKGAELTIGGRPIQTKDFNWDLSYNMSYNHNQITKLTRGTIANYGIIPTTSGISGATGSTIGWDQVGSPVNSFHVYKQVYDVNGKPIEGAYATIPGTTNNLYVDHSAAPDFTLGLSSRMTYKKWFLNFSMHSEIGNYNYNNVQSNNQLLNNSYSSSGFLMNIVSSALVTNFANAQYFSDYYVQNASFLKMDNISLGYNFTKLFNTKLAASLYGTVQNVFTITNYKGLDPEVAGGIDNNIYPRPQVYLVGLKLNF
ncbi:MAG: TonB-dependent receptor [Paludibacter sp.]|nr:TonB-dependent receptor [Paludibacter sp.]